MPFDVCLRSLSPLITCHRRGFVVLLPPADDAERQTHWLKHGWCDTEGRPVIPREVLNESFEGAARRMMSPLAAFINPAESAIRLTYEGAAQLSELWTDWRFVDEQYGSVRPRFNRWSCDLQLLIDGDDIDQERVIELLADAGAAGIGYGTPVFGRFEVTKCS